MSVRHTQAVRYTHRWARLAVAGVVAVAVGVPAAGPAAAEGRKDEGGFRQVDLVSDVAGRAQLTDPNLVNPWGLSAGPDTPIWVSDNGTDSSTLYRGATDSEPATSIVPLVVKIPDGAPTGTVFNGGSGFVVSAGGVSAPSRFLFASENGSIDGWAATVPPPAPGSGTPPPSSTLAQHAVTTPDAVYKGLAIAETSEGTQLYAANFRAGTIDVFDSSFAPVHDEGAFIDKKIPKGYAPFNVQNLNGRLYVTYAQQNEDKHDDVAGPGHGFVDVFDTAGHLLRRLVKRGALDSPWGLAIAPDNFGRFSHALLVGNFGDGHIDAYNPRTGSWLGALRDEAHRPVSIDGLWALRLGSSAFAGPQTLVFSAGPDGEKHGLVGTISAAGS